MNTTQLCPSCGAQARPITHTPGSILIELLLWCCFLLPGLVYSLWRLSARKRNVCPHCRNPGMIALDSPQAQQIAYWQRHLRSQYHPW